MYMYGDSVLWDSVLCTCMGIQFCVHVWGFSSVGFSSVYMYGDSVLCTCMGIQFCVHVWGFSSVGFSSVYMYGDSVLCTCMGIQFCVHVCKLNAVMPPPRSYHVSFCQNMYLYKVLV